VQALAEAKADARARGDMPLDSQPTSTRNKTPDRERYIDIMSGQAGSLRGRPRREDPQPLTSAIEGLVDTRGWQQRAAMGSVFGRWAEIVGRDLAAHTRPDSFADGELAVTADSTIWAAQVRLLAPQLVRTVNAELGEGVVLRVKVRGPSSPRRRGGWRVPGSKGPGDTYG
jgi:predicted nucleic acid-binding Zn ribbon protein